MNRILMWSMLLVTSIFIMGCSTTKDSEKETNYISKESIEIPNKGEMTIINKGASNKEYQNKIVMELLVKVTNDMHPLSTEFSKNEGKDYTALSLPNEATGYYRYYAVYDKNEKLEPAKLKIGSKDGLVYVDKYYYPVINPNLNLDLDPEWFTQ